MPKKYFVNKFTETCGNPAKTKKCDIDRELYYSR